MKSSVAIASNGLEQLEAQIYLRSYVTLLHWDVRIYRVPNNRKCVFGELQVSHKQEDFSRTYNCLGFSEEMIEHSITAKLGDHVTRPSRLWAELQIHFPPVIKHISGNCGWAFVVNHFAFHGLKGRARGLSSEHTNCLIGGWNGCPAIHVL
jgi:hypothetical protein